MGAKDSSKTRVQPILGALGDGAGGTTWIRDLAMLGSRAQSVLLDGIEGTPSGPPQFELAVRSPLAFLEWMIRNPRSLQWPTRKGAPAIFGQTAANWRGALLGGHPLAQNVALQQLATYGAQDRAWWVFEGVTKVDAALFASDAVLFIEGKRTEPKLTGRVEWYRDRDQVYRNLDCLQAWDGRAQRNFLVLLVVEEGTRCAAEAAQLDGEGWRRARRSWPHRSEDDARALWERHYAGWTTWQAVARRWPSLPFPD